MSNYGIIYQSTFDPIGPVSATPIYEIDILQKDYTGGIISILCAGTPAVHSFQTDDPKAPIKGSSLRVSFINEGSLPLSSFLSDDDQFFKVRLYKSGALLYEGFIVQDDCSEILVDYNHEIVISSNDGLGLLKGVNIDKSPAYFVPVFSDAGDTYSTIAGNTLVISAKLAPNVLVGDILKIHNIIFDATYTVVDNTGITTLIVKETVSTSPSPITADITVTRASLLDKVTLASIIGSCLLNTGLELNIKVWGRIHEITQDLTECFLLQTLIDPQTFITGTTTTGMPGSINVNLTDYQSSYDVLTKLLSRFKFTLFQANGVWNLVRWDDLLYYANLIPSYNFDSTFTYLGTENLPAAISIAANLPPAAIPDYFPTYGFLHRVNRGLEFDKETFNYKQLGLLIRNQSLTLLGNLLKTYPIDLWITADGTIHLTDPGHGGGYAVKTAQGHVNEYTALWYQPDIYLARLPGDQSKFFIRVVFDNYGREIDRYLVLANANSSGINTTWVDAYKIEANKDDLIGLSFSSRTNDHIANARVRVFIMLETINGRQYLTFSGWVGSESPYINNFPGFYEDEWNSFSIGPINYKIPDSGLLHIIFFPESDQSDNITLYETHIKDINLTFTPIINGSTSIIGQFSQTTQTNAVKQNGSVEVFVDSSPRNSIAGTLFLNQMAVNIQARTDQWRHTYYSESENLGQLTTGDEMFWRRKTRAILEGTVYGTAGVSMLSVFKYDQFSSLNLVLGKVDIDYKNNNFTGTLWELYEDGEAPCVTYSFGNKTFPVGAWSFSGTACDGTAFNYSSISGTGAIPAPICAQKGSIVCTGDVAATEQGTCGDFVSNYKFQYLYNPI